MTDSKAYGEGEKIRWWPVIVLPDGSRVMPEEPVKKTIETLEAKISSLQNEVRQQIEVALTIVKNRVNLRLAGAPLWAYEVEKIIGEVEKERISHLTVSKDGDTTNDK